MIQLRKNRFEIVLFALCSLLLSPLISEVTTVDIATISLLNLTFVSFASFITAVRKTPRILIMIVATISLMLIWAEYLLPAEGAIQISRASSLLALYVVLAYILIRNFLDATEVNLHVIFGAMAGLIVLGLIGGSLFEIMQYFNPNSFEISSRSGGFDLYYYSFISMTTVGFGDVLPITAAAKSLTILLSLLGQFYLTIGIALFVGKHLQTVKTPS